MGRDDNVNTGRARHLRNPSDRALNIRRRGLHQVRQLVDHDHHVRNFFRNRDFIFPRDFDFTGVLCRDIARFRSRLFLRPRVEADDVAHTDAGEHFVTALHFIDQPTERE